MSNWWGIAGEAATIIGPLLGKILNNIGKDLKEDIARTKYGELIIEANLLDGTLTAISHSETTFNLSLHSPSSNAMLNVYIPKRTRSINIMPYLDLLSDAYATIAPIGKELDEKDSESGFITGAEASFYATTFKTAMMALGTRLMVTERISLKRTEDGFELDMPLAPADRATAYLAAIYGGAFIKMKGIPFKKTQSDLEGDLGGGYKFELPKHIPDPKAPNVFEDVQLSYNIGNVSQYHELIYNNAGYSFVKS